MTRDESGGVMYSESSAGFVRGLRGVRPPGDIADLPLKTKNNS